MDTVLSSETSEVKEVLPFYAPLPRPGYSFSQRLRSGYHAVWYQIGERLK